MKILAIDPGPVNSAFVLMEDGRIIKFGHPTNDYLRQGLVDRGGEYGDLVIEKIESFGMAIGAEVMETIYWSGIFAASYGLAYTHRITRRAVKLHLCGSSRAKDSNVRMALIDRYGGEQAAKGRKACPGPLYGISSHLWSAVAVAVTFADTHDSGRSTDPRDPAS